MRGPLLPRDSFFVARMKSYADPHQVVDLSQEAAPEVPRAAAVRPARRAAVAAKATYKEELSSEAEEVESDDAEGDSDFEASD